MIPKVSVIIPNYNHARFLKQRIDSVLNQEYDDFEIILLDDCSTDDSRTIIAEYANNPKITIYLNDSNSGSTFKQWNKGLQLTKGELIWIAESDDIADPSFLKNAVDILNHTQEIGLYECRSYWVDENSNVMDPEPLQVIAQEIKGKEFIMQQLLNGNSIHNASAVVFRKSLVELPISRDISDLKYCGDWLFWVKILAKSNFYLSNQYHNYFRRHQGNVSSNAEINGLAFLEGIKIYGYIRTLYKSSFLNPIKLADRIWANNVLFSELKKEVKSKFLKLSFSVNPFINLLYYYYSIKRTFKNYTK